MRKVILYIAVSLDGYIADSEGSVEWISGQDKNVEMEDTFTPFFSGVARSLWEREPTTKL